MNEPTADGESSRRDRALIASAAEWRLLAVLLERPRAGWREEIEALAREVPDPELRTAAREARDAREGTYLRLMGPGGSVSPREVTYRPLEDPGWVLADLARYYEAFAFHPRAEDPIDHVAVEADFSAYLLLKEAFARARGDAKGAQVTAEAHTRFFTCHLAAIATPFAERVAEIGPAHLATAARVLAARVPAPPWPPAGLPRCTYPPRLLQPMP
jgi:TorA maturation chaperone TorD